MAIQQIDVPFKIGDVVWTHDCKKSENGLTAFTIKVIKITQVLDKTTILVGDSDLYVNSNLTRMIDITRCFASKEDLVNSMI